MPRYDYTRRDRWKDRAVVLVLFVLCLLLWGVIVLAFLELNSVLIS